MQTNPDMAFSMEGSSYGGSWAIWENPKDDALNIKWQDETVAILKRFTQSHYIGETDIVQDSKRVQESYSPEKWHKLEKIRQKYDPTGLFFGFFGGISD